MAAAKLDTLTPCAWLPESERIEAARLAAEAMSSLYEPIRDIAPQMLAGEFSVEGSELADAVALAGEGVRGMIASYPADEYQARQRVSLHHALGNLGPSDSQKLIAQLRALAGKIPQGSMHGEYIARFAVRPDLRGSGTANELMQLFLARHPAASLHVRADNQRAVGFYRRHGFEAGADAGEFLLMLRD